MMVALAALSFWLAGSSSFDYAAKHAADNTTPLMFTVDAFYRGLFGFPIRSYQGPTAPTSLVSSRSPIWRISMRVRRS